jgi:UDP-N-acetylmuramoyl-L-alanyl-D-glutamate--2,6-diaminopimelate ligase
MTATALVDAAGATGVAARISGDGSVTIGGMTLDSNRVRTGDLYCCIRGERADGHDYAAGAVVAGATALLVDHLLDVGATQLVVPDTRLAVGPLAATFWDHPSDRMAVVGITGTNGKTTTSYLLAAVLERAGWPTGVLGTLTGSFTTPEAPDLQARLAEMADSGRRAVAMEVSSHALALHRVDGTRFAVAVFTNLGRDHLDLHGTIERYFAAKASLFTPGRAAVGVVNVDDVHGRQLADAAAIPIVPFGLDDAASLVVGATSSHFRWRGHEVTLPLGGRFNVANALAAATAAAALGIAEDVIAAGLGTVAPVAGRMEQVEAGQPFRVVVDFAHTPDALAGLLAELREVTPGRVIVVFGCGGDRDADKRPMMGRSAAEGADLVVVTSDNPRSEDPEAIVAAIMAGVPVARRGRVVTEVDRREAIARALAEAAAGDVVVIAGKGHETTQTVAGEKRPFDDRAVARELLEGAR